MRIFLSKKITAIFEGEDALYDTAIVVIPLQIITQSRTYSTHYIEEFIDLVSCVNTDAVMVSRKSVTIGQHTFALS